jgi:predicted dehydrogenase
LLQKINVALVGCGYVANSHLKAWRKVKQAQVSAVCDLNEAMARNERRFVPKLLYVIGYY